MRGYLSFLRRLLLNRPAAVFRGASLPLVGRVGACYTLFDIGTNAVRRGDYIELPVPLIFPGREIKYV